jgi:hypothetical protein
MSEDVLQCVEVIVEPDSVEQLAFEGGEADRLRG